MRDQPNHYAAPAAPPEAFSPGTRLQHARLKYYYLATLIAPFVLSLTGIAVPGLMALFGVLTLVIVFLGIVEEHSIIDRDADLFGASSRVRSDHWCSAATARR